ncbi:MAG: DUF1987 domain-containing protein [Cytophagales bacterium]|nr:DUF1987 domain-containing protein [Cytophagales bacterium]
MFLFVLLLFYTFIIMDILNFNAEEDTPNIIFDPKNNKFEISGNSFPENTSEYYSPILDWLDQYCAKPNKYTKIVFNLDYFNSSSYKCFLELLYKLEKISKEGYQVDIIWCYKENDTEMKNVGKELQEMVDLGVTVKKI